MKSLINSYVVVKVASSELGVRRGQIRDLISKKMIDYKLENGNYMVDINSIDESILGDLKKGKYTSPKVGISKTTNCKGGDKLRTEVISNVINGFKEDKLQSYFKDKYDLYKSYCDANSIEFDDSNHQFIVQHIINEYHCLDTEDVGCPINRFGDYSFIFVKEVDGMSDGFYFIDAVTTVAINLTKQMMSMEFGKTTTYKIYKDHHCLHLTIDDFIEEFSPKDFYKQNSLWSQYLAVCGESEITVINRKSHTNKLHTVNGYWKRQPYGSRKNPTYKTIWVDEFERGKSTVKEAA